MAKLYGDGLDTHASNFIFGAWEVETEADGFTLVWTHLYMLVVCSYNAHDTLKTELK
jgi:hypothetical protein